MEAHDDELEPAAASGDDPIPGTTPVPDPPPVPVTSPVSGLYDGPAKPVRLGSAPFGTRPIKREVIRLDVDGRYPHSTAVLSEKGGTRWAVDSWYEPMGGKPDVMPLDQWKSRGVMGER